MPPKAYDINPNEWIIWEGPGYYCLMVGGWTKAARKNWPGAKWIGRKPLAYRKASYN